MEPGLLLAFRSPWVILLSQLRGMLLMLTQRKGRAMSRKCFVFIISQVLAFSLSELPAFRGTGL